MFTLRRIYLACGLAAIAVYFYLPYGDTTRVLYMAVSASTPIAIGVGLYLFKSAKRGPWLLMAAGFVLYVVGDAIFMILSYTMAEVPFPNIGDAAYIAFYPLVFFAFGWFVRAGGQRNRAAWLDASIWTVGAALLAWEPLLEPYVTDTATEWLPGLTALAYPVMDIALLMMLLRMFVGRTPRTPAYWLLMAGLASQTVSDTLYGLNVFNESAIGGRLVDVGWLLTYVAVGTAAMHPSMVRMTERSDGQAPLASRARLISLIIPVLLAPGLLVYQLVERQGGELVEDGLVIAAGSAILVLLVLARGAGLLVIAERHAGQLVSRQGRLEELLTERESTNAELNYRVTKDALTGLSNRAFFVSALANSLATDAETSMAFLDLDDFKSINDTLGHEAGDLLLVGLAERLTAIVGRNDLVARFGGDEFAVLLNGGDVEDLARRVLETLEEPIVLHGREHRLQVSIGVTTADDGNPSTSDLLRRADIAMYSAKRSNGGWARYQTGMSAALLSRMDLRQRLVAGLRDREIEPWFQPVVDLGSGALRGFEALARWVPDTGPELLPGDWLPMAEETGLVVEVDRTVCQAAFAQLAVWRAEYPSAQSLHLAINLSARTLQQPGIAEELLKMLFDLGVPASRIVVEVTEGVLIEDENVSARLQVLRSAGVRVALDDFGTGWSSLSYLQKFPVDMLKLDRSFTAELGPDPGGDAIPAAVLQLARAMSLGVIAEGVETLDQLESLLTLGFREAQGYLFARAEPADRLDELLRQEHPHFASAETRAHHRAVDEIALLAG